MRHRESAELGWSGGTAHWLGAGSLGPYTSLGNRYRVSDDEVGNWDEVNPLYLEQQNDVLWYLYGLSRPDASFAWDYGGYAVCSPAGAHAPAGSSEPSDNWSVSEALARSNPNRPHVDLPVFLTELKDVPNMVRTLMGTALRRAGRLSTYDKRFLKSVTRRFRDNRVYDNTYDLSKTYLAYTFGVVPFFSDLYRMMDFANQVENRAQALTDLYSGGGLSRRTTVWNDDVDFAPWRTYQSPLYSEATIVNAIWRTTRQKWVSTKWVPSTPPSYHSDAERLALANSLTFGRNISMATIYELLPWSWLLDWFSNVGDLVASTRNSVPVTHRSTAIMQSTVTRLVSHEREGPGVESSELTAPRSPTRATKVRRPYDLPLVPEFRVPFLNGKQLSILSALLGAKNRAP